MAAMSRSSKHAKVRDLSLTAVALQDHIARNTGLIKNTVRSHKPENNRSTEEDGLYTGRPPLTLAQRLGLIEKPAPLLTESQWDNVKITSCERGDSYQSCPICHDEFRLKPQVLLSCSHTFHKSCVLAFERFSGKKDCPLCRHPSYQMRVITSASKIYMEKAATRIQAVWRGYCIRKWYNSYRETHPPSHPKLKKRYYEQKLSKVTDQFVENCIGTSDTLDLFFASIDNDIRQSRQVMRAFDSQNDLVSWEEVKQKAMLFITNMCAVCLTELHFKESNNRPLSVLSCSHLLHTCCISSLETYSQSSQPYLCPICRTPYTRTAFT